MTVREKANLKNVADMKKVLAQKLKDENTYFTSKDITFKAIECGYQILIKDYEHIPFEMKFDYDEYFGYIVTIEDMFNEDIICFVDSKIQYDIAQAMISLGYYIGSRF